MSSKKDARREGRLATALKDNLKRRKAQAKAKAATSAPPARTLGTAPQAGLEGEPKKGPNTAQKR